MHALVAGPRSRREVLGTLFAGSAMALAATAGAPAARAAPAAIRPGAAEVRRLMALSSRRALAKLSRPGGFWDSPVARVPLPKLFRPGGVWPGPLASSAFRDDLTHRLNTIAEAGARNAVSLAGRTAARVAVPDPPAVLAGPPTGATTLLRAEIGPRLVNTLTPALAQALARARDPVIRRATLALRGVSPNDVARALANATESAIWYAIGAEEAAIRRDPAAAGDPALAAALRAG